jgi:subtilase family serine protease
MSRTVRSRCAVFLMVASLAVGAFVSRAAGPAHAAASAGRSELPGTRPGWATPSADRGPVSRSATVTAVVYLAGRNPAGLAAYARAVSDPRSADYGRYLTRSQAATRFGASAAQVGTVADWLTEAGLKVTAAAPDHVDVTGTAADAESAFGVGLHQYAVGGTTYSAPTSELTVPAALSATISTVTGLSPASGEAHAAPAVTAPSGSVTAQSKPEPCSDYWDQQLATALPAAYGRTAPYRLCGYTPAQLRSAYGVARSGLTGRGVTVAVIDAYASPTMRADANQDSVDMGDQPLRPAQYAEVRPASFTHVTDGLCGAVPNWWRDESLTVEGAHAMAPDARITYVAAASCLDSDLIAAVDTVVDNRLADIVSIPWHLVLQASWGSRPPSDIDAFEQAFERGAVEGIGFYAASGNCGDEDPALLCSAGMQSTVTQTEYPASDPWVTAVGGTTLAVGRHGRYLWETGWSTILSHELPDQTGWQIPSPYFVGGGGGGVSGSFSQPFYQRQVVPAALATHHPDGTTGAPMRVVPDVAMLGDYFNGFWFGETVPAANGSATYTESGFGGTGLAVALFAGIQADAQQARGRARIGFANPGLYARYGTPDYHDVTDQPLGQGVSIGVAVYNPAENAYAIDTLAQDGDLHATTGYDDATGLGSPTRAYLESYR